MIAEAMQPVRDDLTDAIADSERRLGNRIDALENQLNDRIDTTNENMQAQLAEQEKNIGQLIGGAKK